MELPDSLPAQLYLLTYNPDKERMDGSSLLGPALRAAALLELRQRGRIIDEGGKVAPVLGTRGAGQVSQPGTVGARRVGALTVDDPVLTRVLEQVGASGRPRSWKHWIGKDNRWTTRCARDYLEAGRWIRVDRTRVLGIVPRTVVTVRDPRTVRALINDVRRALRGPGPADRLGDRDRQLAALGALAEIRVLGGWRERHAHRARIGELTASIAPAGPALRKVIQTQKAAHASGGG
ncbi:GPP34 family phosphoprotein [Pseudofrankia sp. DC12]|uniref:GOLPH3/VPS74 family protein n=1 Tax=Pseudofrankia sp. DC12 TaxID=683315 RepID=UPI0005F7B469|nr:GPP34 family phosphoprotein [Pseudofrankia sp. DC12]